MKRHAKKEDFFMNSRNCVVSWCVVFAVVFSMGMASQHTYAGTAEGQFIFNDTTAQFTHAYAFAQEEEILVIVTNLPLSDEAVEDQWERSAMAREEGLKYVEITINSEQQHTSLNIRLDPMSRSISGVGKLELTVFDEKNVEGRFHSEGEQIVFDNTYNFDFTFAAEIHRKAKLPPPTEAEKDAAADSPQAAIYLELLRAIHAGDIDGLKKVVTSDVAKEIDEAPDQKEALEFLQMITPKEVEFQRILKKDEENMTLIASTEEEDFGTLKGTIELVKEDGMWRVLKENWEQDMSASSESSAEDEGEAAADQVGTAPPESESSEAPEEQGDDEELAASSPKEKYARTVDNMRAIGMALGSYQIDFNYFPKCPSEKDLSAVEWPEVEMYYVGSFKDAWGTPFKYVSTDDGGKYTLTSYGADKVKGDGGGEFDADIVYSDGMFVTPVIEIEIEKPEPKPEPKTPQEKFDRTVEDMRGLMVALGSYQIDFNYFPKCPSEKDLSAVEWPKVEMYYVGSFKDAWGTPFKYVSTDDGGKYTLTSYGADKVKGDGGGEFDADIILSDGAFVAPPSLVQE
jgi:hypothetical protein